MSTNVHYPIVPLPPAVCFQRILHGVADSRGLAPEEEGLQRAIAAQICSAINIATKVAWQFHDWPDACPVMRAALADHPSRPGVRFLPRRGASLHVDTLLGAWDADPLGGPTHDRPFTLVTGGWAFCDEAPAEIYIRFRPPPPQYTVVPHDLEHSYRAGDVVWDDAASGDCFIALQAVPVDTALASEEHWSPLPVLDCLALAIQTGAEALFLKTEGQFDSMKIIETAMLGLLEHEINQIHNQQGATRAYLR